MLEVKTPEFDEWDAFVESSPQGTIFSTTKWCGLFSDPFRIYGCYKGSELVGGIIGIEKGGLFFSGDYPLTMYQGVLVKNLDKYTSLMSLHNQVAEALIPYLYGSVQNHYTYPDIRPFIWAGWQPTVKYTYVVRPDKEKLEKDTRYEIGHEEGLSEISIERFKELYQLTFEKKNLPPPISSEFLDRFFQIMKPYLFGNQNSGAVFIEDNKRAYYIFGASESGHSYRVVWEAMSQFKEVDMVGCNVKEIGLFKRGFGGELKVSLGATNV